MDLMVLMYHRARVERHGNAPELLDAHFAYIAHCYHNVLPGEPLSPDSLNVCLSFDDGYFDFYGIVLPLLKKHRLRALVAIPTGFVVEKSAAPSASRLGVASADAFADSGRGGFCDWNEIQEMADGGHVAFAAHGHTHQSLDAADPALADEIDLPQTLLTTRTGRAVDSFVFPFGRFSPQALRHARTRYRHVFRIGGALNRSWDARVLYRVNADAMRDPWELFSPWRLLGYRARYFWNRTRRR